MLALPHIDEVQPLSDDDRACLNEVREILSKHGKLGRFGLSLLHDHFKVEDDEMLVEFCDEENRVFTIKPLPRSLFSEHELIETNWRLDTGQAMVGCTRYCMRDPQTNQHTAINHVQS